VELEKRIEEAATEQENFRSACSTIGAGAKCPRIEMFEAIMSETTMSKMSQNQFLIICTIADPSL
jgi:hypothetical protein